MTEIREGDVVGAGRAMLRSVAVHLRRRVSSSFTGLALEAGGFGLIVLAAWEVERVAGLVLGGAVLLLYGNRR